MSDLSSNLLLQLKDYSKCNDDLAMLIRKTILEPFQLDLSRPDALRKPPPTPSRFKQMATRLAPLAMRIVNQNIEGLMCVKQATLHTGNYVVAVNCLVDTSFYALTALRHMNTFTTLKPLDLEKTTSNLICKMVELGEYNRALDEIVKFRLLLASVAKVQLDAKKPITVIQKAASPIKSVLTESPRNHQLQTVAMASTIPVVPDSIIKTQWEDDMLVKYQDLFQFPLDPNLKDRTIILLVLAYQMNTLRCWCEIGDGSLSKYVPYFMERSGNFFDWCKQLLKVDLPVAKKQLDTFQRLLYKAANRFPLTGKHRYILC
ncbi:uncharacterized protein BX663DRAFT_425176 [Cokeromyces recurvatus]|uniref:uncharacterized protein n=1 Tax=Cokeromyces recurvatus TaxID=90255 RepID=UPI00221E479F|nr:uncharacterized protein BX663DRAFT_425176 [Cokeromyces recurvatus]KAI7907854.1 hypothetical protein BX663DRAFT_425176 [Cokeromyces recurvatus]